MEVKIRPLREEDAYVSYKWRNDPLVFKYTCNRYTSEITLESELEWIRRVTKKSGRLQMCDRSRWRVCGEHLSD